MNVLFVDDEAILHRTIDLVINWELEGCHLYKAKDGAEAINRLQSQTIDFIILDLDMPILNGFGVLEWLKQNRYPSEVLILTCKDDFIDAQKSAKYDVLDYCLKNELEAKRLQQYLGEVRHRQGVRVSSQIEADKAQALQEREQMMQAKHQLVDYILEKRKKSTLDEQRLQQSLRLFANESMSYFSVLFDFTKSNSCSQITIQPDIEILLDGALGQFRHCLLAVDAHRWMAILEYTIDSLRSQLSTQQLVMQIGDELRDALSLTPQIVLGHLKPTLLGAAGEYSRLVKITDQRFFAPNNKLIDANKVDVETDYVTLYYWHDYLNKFVQFATERNFDQFEHTYLQLVTSINQRQVYFPSSKFTADLIYRFAQENIIISQEISAEDATSFLNIMLAACLDQLSGDQNSTNYLVQKAIIYIRNNYTQELSNEEIADYLGVSANYLSRVFSKETKTSLVSFIQHYRIRMAQRLLQNTHLKVYEISDRTGFNSPIVFSSTFKKITKQTPLQYRNTAKHTNG